MQNKQIWKLSVNTYGDPTDSHLLLNEDKILCTEAAVIIGIHEPSYLNIKIPITDGNLELVSDNTKPIDREIIEVTSEKTKEVKE